MRHYFVTVTVALLALLLPAITFAADAPPQPDLTSLEKRAEAGNVDAMAQLIVIYAHKSQQSSIDEAGRVEYHKQSQKWVKLAATQLSKQTERKIEGLDDPASPLGSLARELARIDSVKQLLPAAEKGDAAAQFGLGNVYSSSLVLQDKALALKWYSKAAEQGNAAALYALSQIYSYGSGVDKDQSRADELLKTAAEKGDAFAQFAMAQSLRGTPEAADWLTRAAEQGLQMAQVYLYKAYQLGKNGVAQDMVKAHFWALVSGQPFIVLERLADQISGDEAEDNQRLAAEWLKAHPPMKPEE